MMKYQIPTISKFLPTTYLCNYKGKNSVGRYHLNQKIIVKIISSRINSNFLPHDMIL